MDIQLASRIAIPALLLTGFAIGGYYRLRAQRIRGSVSRAAEGAILVPLRLAGLGWFLTLLLHVIHPDWLAWSRPALPQGVRAVGLPMAALALGFLWWTFHHLGLNVTDTVVTRRRHELVTTGPYRHVRHPLYTNFLLLGLALSLLTGSALVLALGLVGFGLLMLRTPIEERELVERFGSRYRSYMSRTPRWLPRFRPG